MKVTSAPGAAARARHRLFAYEYVNNGFNATEAALTVGYSPKSAHNTGNDLIKNPEILAMVEELRGPVLARYEVTYDRTIKELALLAYQDIADVLTWHENGLTIKSIDSMPEDARRTIASIKVKRTVRTDDDGGDTVTDEREVRFWSKLEALKLLAQHQGILPTTGKVRLHDSRKQTINIFGELGLSRDEVLLIANQALSDEVPDA